MSLRALFLYSLVFCLVHGQDDTDTTIQNCDFNFQYVTNNEPVNITQVCNEKPCLVKCCPEKQILILRNEATYCISSSDVEHEFNVTNLNDYSKVSIYNKDIEREIIKTGKTIKNFSLLYSNSFVNCSDETDTEILQILKEPLYRKFITVDGKLKVENLNYLEHWMTYDVGTFCFEHMLEVDEDESLESSTPKLVLYSVIEYDNEDGDSNDRAVFNTYWMMVSIFFMLIVLVVYSLLRELQNLAGMMLMAYLASFIAFFIFRIIHVNGNEDGIMKLDETGCIVMTILVYFTIMSTFSWMNIMSFDMWWTLRGIRKQRPIHSRGIIVKFLWYCLYAWGVPLLLTLFVIIVDNIDLTSVPYFVVPHVFYESNCFFTEDSHNLYVSTPLGIMIAINICLFVMTAYNIWHVRRGVTSHSAGNSKINENNEYRFMVYVKLSLVMGVSWALEILSNFFDMQSKMWYIIDFYNSLIGLFLFITFVCKRTIFLRLCSRFEIDNDFVRKVRAGTGDTTQVSDGTRSTHSSVTARTNEPFIEKRPSAKY